VRHRPARPRRATVGTRTGLPDDTLTCAIPANDVGSLLERLAASTAADRLVSAFAADDMARNFTLA